MNALIQILAPLLQEKITCYGKIMTVLEEEQVLIRDGDVDRLWESSCQKRNLTKSIEDARKSILLALFEADIDHGMSLDRFSPRKAAALTGEDGIRLLMPLLDTLDSVKRTVHDMSKTNTRFATEYLSVVEDIIGVFATAADASDGYTPGYQGNGKNTNSLLFNARV